MADEDNQKTADGKPITISGKVKIACVQETEEKSDSSNKESE